MKSSKTVIVFLLIILWNATILSTVKAAAESVEYEHDSNGRLIRVHHGNSEHIRYEYDANGNRLRSKMIKDVVTLPKNLVRNHQFQQTAQNGEALYWKKEIWGAAESDFALVDHQTNRMQKISGNKIAKNGMVAVSQTFEVVGSKEFKTSAIFQVDHLQHATVQLYVDFLNTDDVFVGANITEWDKRTDGGYITLANHGQVPANAKKAIIYAILRGIEDDGAGTILVDSLRFSYETDKNLLSNPYFEPGINLDIAEDWNKAVWSSGSSHFATARYGLNKVQKITASQMKSNEMTAISQTIKVEKQKDYTVSGLFKIDHLQGSKVQLYIDFMSGAGQFIGANVTEYEQPTNGHFIVLSNSGKVPDNAEKAIVYAIIRGIADQSSGTIYVDSLNSQYSDERNLLSNPEFRIYPDQDEIGDGWTKRYGLLTAVIFK